MVPHSSQSYRDEWVQTRERVGLCPRGRQNGLDLSEVVMRTEEVFSISIPDEDAERICTVGVLETLSLPYLGSCGPTHIAGFVWTHSSR
jgi:hypothetical protein